MIKLTSKGTAKVNKYIRELEAKRKEILDAGKDTTDETELPTVEDIISDIEFIGLDKDGEYINNWGVTDNYDGDSALCLKKGEDFIGDINESKRLNESDSGEKWREVTHIEDYEFDPDGKYDGTLYKEDWEEIFQELYQRGETTEEYLYNDWVEPQSTRNARTYFIKKNGVEYIVMKYYDGMYALYEINRNYKQNESKVNVGAIIEKLDAGISIRQAIYEASNVKKPAVLLEDVVGMDPAKADDFKALMDKWVGSNSGWKYEKFTENNGKTYFVRLTKNPIAKLPDAVDLEVTRGVLNGELFYDKAGEFLAASGPVSLAGVKSILRDLLSQVEMADSEAEEDTSSENGDIFGY